jgi:hypothetical protein
MARPTCIGKLGVGPEQVQQLHPDLGLEDVADVGAGLEAFEDALGGRVAASVDEEAGKVERAAHQPNVGLKRGKSFEQCEQKCREKK